MVGKREKALEYGRCGSGGSTVRDRECGNEKGDARQGAIERERELVTREGKGKIVSVGSSRIRRRWWG